MTSPVDSYQPECGWCGKAQDLDTPRPSREIDADHWYIDHLEVAAWCSRCRCLNVFVFGYSDDGVQLDTYVKGGQR